MTVKRPIDTYQKTIRYFRYVDIEKWRVSVRINTVKSASYTFENGQLLKIVKVNVRKHFTVTLHVLHVCEILFSCHKSLMSLTIAF